MDFSKKENKFIKIQNIQKSIANSSVGKQVGQIAPQVARLVCDRAKDSSLPIAIAGCVIEGLLDDKIGKQSNQENEKVAETPSVTNWNPK